jgi:hypothetical protein
MTLRLILIVLLLATFFGTTQTAGQSDRPTVAVAVAPHLFIPWIFDTPGIGSSIVEVKIQPDGHVSSAKCIGGSEDFPWRDHSFEDTALKWRFSSTDGLQERTARLTFVFRIMPKGTSVADLTPIYTAPYQMEIRHIVFDAPVTSDPLPIPEPKKRP